MTATEIAVLRVLLSHPLGVEHWFIPEATGLHMREVSNTVESLSEFGLIHHNGVRWCVTEKGRSQYEAEAPKPEDREIHFNPYFIAALAAGACLLYWIWSVTR